MASPGVFDLEPLIEPSNLPQGIKVTTLELCGNSIYIGTDQGSIIRYSCNNLDVQSVRRERIRDLGPKAPVTFLRSASALDRILALCDTNLMVLNATDLTSLSLTGSQKMRGIQACCINENPTVDDPFALQVKQMPNSKLFLTYFTYNVTVPNCFISRHLVFFHLTSTIVITINFYCSVVNR